MSVVGKAADVIREHGFDECLEPECIAADLDHAGVLAPEGLHYVYEVQAQYIQHEWWLEGKWCECDYWGRTMFDYTNDRNNAWEGAESWGTLDEARECAEKVKGLGGRRVRIVRRAVTGIEVVE